MEVEEEGIFVILALIKPSSQKKNQKTFYLHSSPCPVQFFEEDKPLDHE